MSLLLSWPSHGHQAPLLGRALPPGGRWVFRKATTPFLHFSGDCSKHFQFETPYSFPTVLSEAGVTQSPRYVIIRERQEVSFWCEPISGHTTLYWYQQPRDQGIQFLTYFQNEAIMDDSQLPKDRFSAVRPQGVNSTLKIQSSKLGDSATYFCASSLATAVQRHLPAVHKTDGFPQESIQQRPLLASHTP